MGNGGRLKTGIVQHGGDRQQIRNVVTSEQAGFNLGAAAWQNQRKTLAVLFPDKFVGDQQSAEQACRQPRSEVAGTLEVKNEQRGKDAAKEKLEEQVRHLPDDSGKPPTPPRPLGSDKTIGIPLGQPQNQQTGSQQKRAERPQIERPYPLPDRQGIPGKAAEKGSRRIQALEEFQVIDRLR